MVAHTKLLVVGSIKRSHAAQPIGRSRLVKAFPLCKYNCVLLCMQFTACIISLGCTTLTVISDCLFLNKIINLFRKNASASWWLICLGELKKKIRIWNFNCGSFQIRFTGKGNQTITAQNVEGKTITFPLTHLCGYQKVILLSATNPFSLHFGFCSGTCIVQYLDLIYSAAQHGTQRWMTIKTADSLECC